MTKERVDAAINWFTANTPMVLALLGSVVGLVSYINGLDARLSKAEDKMQGRIMYADKMFGDIGGQLNLLTNLPYRMQQVEVAQTGMALRMDKVSETLLNAVEGIKRDVSQLTTQLAVTSAKIDSLDVPRVQSRAAMPPSPGEYIPSLRPQTASSAGPLSPLR